MNYNKKQMQPLIEKFQINPETNKLFIKIIEMFDNQPNYQIWAVKGVFNKTFDFETLSRIHDWVVLNQPMIKNLEKKNIVSYSTKAAITQLFHEMTALDNLAVIKDVISHFNTEQRKMLTESIIPEELNGLQAYQNTNVKKWGGILNKFNALPSFRKNNFYTKASGVRNAEELLDLISSAIEATYRWDKDDFLAYLKNNTRGVEVVFNKDSCVIIRVPNFETSKKLCGGGRTQWCISMEKDHWNSYVGTYKEREQYFLFDFSRRETDPFAHIGFTIQKGEGIVEAQSCDNQPMLHEAWDNGKEKLTVHDVLTAFGVKKGTFIRLPENNEFNWDTISILEFIKNNPDKYAIAFEKDKRYVINCLTSDGVSKLVGHTMINAYNFGVHPDTKIYVLLDTNLPVNDEKAVVAMRFVKDSYGSLSIVDGRDLFNTDILATYSSYLDEIGISRNDFLNCEAIDPSILLHKYIDEHDEVAAVKLIEENYDTINVNFEFESRVPVIAAVNSGMFKLFNKVINHPKFNATIEDGFGATLPITLLYLYSAEDVTPSSEDEKKLASLISEILECNTFDLNARDLSGDSILTITCQYEKMVWIGKKLVLEKNVDVNTSNLFGETPVGICITNKNLEMLRILGKRGDLIISDENRKLAKANAINLDDYIKPQLNSLAIDDVESLINEFEIASR